MYGIILFDLVNSDSDCAAKFYLLRSSGVACRALADAYFIPRIAPKDLYGVADVLSLRNWLRILWTRPSFHRTIPTLAFSPFSSSKSHVSVICKLLKSFFGGRADGLGGLAADRNEKPRLWGSRGSGGFDVF